MNGKTNRRKWSFEKIYLRKLFFYFLVSIAEKYPYMYSQLLYNCQPVNIKVMLKKNPDRISTPNKEIIVVIIHSIIAGKWAKANR